MRELFSNGEKVVSFRVDPECRNIQRFQVEGGQFEKLQTSDTFQMYSTEPFLAEERSYFSILLEKSKYRSLTMGLITADLFEKASSSAAKGCLCYEGYYGIVIVEGKEDNRDYRKIAEGDILSALLDPISGLVEWRINLELIAKVALPEAMLHTALFPYFELEDKGDRILVNPETQ